MSGFESIVEDLAITWLDGPGLRLLMMLRLGPFVRWRQGRQHYNMASYRLLRILQHGGARSLRGISRWRRPHQLARRRRPRQSEEAPIEAMTALNKVAGIALHLDGPRCLLDVPKRGDALGITEDDIAFYDAFTDLGNLKEVIGDAVVAPIAYELVDAIRASGAVDGTEKDAARACILRQVKRLPRQHGNPSDKQERVVKKVIEQAVRACQDRVGSA